MQLEQIQTIEAKVERELFDWEGCVNCCEVIRKMKGSILAYKSYLVQEGEALDQMVDRFRATASEARDGL